VNMSYSIVGLPTTNIGPGYAYLSGAGDLGAFWNKKSVRKRVKARKAKRKAKRKASGKKKKTGKIIGAVLTGGLSLVFKKKKKKTKAAAAPAEVPPEPRPEEATTAEEQTTDLQETLAEKQASMPAAVEFPWIPIAIGVGSVFLIGTIAILASRKSG